MDNRTPELQATADAAEAEKNGAAAELGKFKDVEALMQAYTALEAEFTRRSQRLKELEKTNKEAALSAGAGNGVTPSDKADGLPQAAEVASISDEVKKAVIEEYLCGVSAHRSVPMVLGGSVVQAQRRVPQNVREAGTLARNFLNNKEEQN